MLKFNRLYAGTLLFMFSNCFKYFVIHLIVFSVDKNKIYVLEISYNLFVM